MDEYFFTSESVAEGHPDNIADQISDAILDAYLLRDPWAKVACECLVKTGAVILAGEISSAVNIDVEQIVRITVKAIGYDDSDKGFDGATGAVMSRLGRQSEDIARGIRASDLSSLGVGDQGITFGYVDDETPQLIPAPLKCMHID